MRKKFIGINTKGQTAVEYMLLLAAVVSIVLIGFKTYLPELQLTSNYYFNQVGIGILGEPNKCCDDCCGSLASGSCMAHVAENCEKCPADCGACPPPPPT